MKTKEKTKVSINSVIFSMTIVFNIVFEMFNTDTASAERIRANAVAGRIAALPFAAGCDDADQCAVLNLTGYMIASMPGPGRALFDHRPSNDHDIMDRLKPIMHFKGGDQAVIDQGMAEIAEVLVKGYHRDIEADAISGEYNTYGAEARSIHDDLDALAAVPKVFEFDQVAGAVVAGLWWN
jgi:hypothetical protein